MTATDVSSPGTDSSLGLIGDIAVTVMDALGGPGAALLIAAENLFPPIPSELILPLAGYYAGRGHMSLVEAIAWTTVGSLVGAAVVYVVARLIGPDRIRAVFRAVPLLRVGDFDAAEAWFVRHGAKAVLLGRFVPIFRSLISLPAGVTRMNPLLFVGLSALGSLGWNTIFVVAGYALGANWHAVEQYADVLQYVVIGAVVVVLTLFLVLRIRLILRERRDGGLAA